MLFPTPHQAELPVLDKAGVEHLLTLNHFFLWSCSVLHPMLGVPSLGLAVAWPDGLRDRRGAAICLWTGQKTGFASAGTP